MGREQCYVPIGRIAVIRLFVQTLSRAGGKCQPECDFSEEQRGIKNQKQINVHPQPEAGKTNKSFSFQRNY